MKQRLSTLFTEKTTYGHLLLSAFLGISFGVSVHNYVLARVFPPTSKRAYFITIVLVLTGALGYLFLLDRLVVPVFSRLKIAQRYLVVTASLLLGMFLMLAGTNISRSPVENIIFLLPDQTVEITVPKTQAVSNPQIAIQYFFTSAGVVSYDSINYTGWKRSGDQLVLTDLTNNSFRWTGKTGQRAALVLLRSPQGGMIDVSWDGFTERVNLYLDRKDKYTYNHYYSIPFYASKEMAWLLLGLNFVLAASVLILFAWREKDRIMRVLMDSISPLSHHQPRNRLSGGGQARPWFILSIVLVAALILRTLFLGRAYLYIDEFPHLNASKDVLSGVSLDSVYQRSLYIVTLPVALFTHFFGFNLWSAKLPGVIFNTLSIIPLYLIVEKVNKKAAVWACILYATSPWVIATARNVREYAYYPFFFYWIVYGMISFIEKFPNDFLIRKDWKSIIGWQYVIPAILLLLPPLYATLVDPLSTFKVVLIAYGVFLLFLARKFNLRDRSNLFIIGTVGLAMATVICLSKRDITAWIQGFSAYPLRYFFQNPQQQWYYNKLAIVFVLAFAVSIAVGILFRQRNFVPLFLSVLFLASAAVFTLFFDRYIRPRYVINMQYWYIPLLGMGLYAMWSVACLMLTWRVGKCLLVLALLPLTVNMGQILLPTTYDEYGFMPVTEEYEYNLEAVDKLLSNEAKKEDVLVGTIYGGYSKWRGVLDMEIYAVKNTEVKDLQQYVYSVVDSHNSGWIVLDTRVSSRVLIRNTFQRDGKTVEFIGQLEDQLVWKWHTNRDVSP